MAGKIPGHGPRPEKVKNLKREVEKMHSRIWNFTENEYTDLELFERLQNIGIDYVDEIREKDWPGEIEDFIYAFARNGLKISKRGNHLKVNYMDLKAYFEKHKNNINDKYGFLFIDEYSEIITEYDWIENLLYVCEGEETISLVFRQVFDYHF